jgi:hypothetical protein
MRSRPCHFNLCILVLVVVVEQTRRLCWSCCFETVVGGIIASGISFAAAISAPCFVSSHGTSIPQ